MFAPRVSVKSKAVTSGRLTGAVKANRTRGTSKSKPEAAYSLYSEDAEEQVVTLHKGLDRCAALLGDILQCENPGSVPKQDSAVTDGRTQPRPHPLTGKKAIRRCVYKSGGIPRNTQMVRRKSSKPPATTPQRSTPRPHCGVSLQPAVRTPHLSKTPSKPDKPHGQPGLLPAVCVPERDKGSSEVSETGRNMRRVRVLLEELKTLMAGHGDSTQTYLYLLEQTVLSALGSEVSKNPLEQQRTEELRSLQSHNAQLQRQVMVLQQQLQELEATQRLLNSQVSSLQMQLSAADKNLTRLQNSLQETESRLQSGQEENISVKTELESTRGRLWVTLQDKLKLEAMLQQKQQEIETLHRVIESVDSSTPTPDSHPACPPGSAKEHITQYLLSLEQAQPPSPHVPETLQGPERDVESVISDWSVQSESSFNTRDEAVFRDGLAALDASIASLQKTLKMDLVKM